MCITNYSAIGQVQKEEDTKCSNRVEKLTQQ